MKYISLRKAAVAVAGNCHMTIGEALGAIDIITPVDEFAEVIRCSECKWFSKNYGGYLGGCEEKTACAKLLTFVDENDFCSMGEFKNE